MRRGCVDWGRWIAMSRHMLVKVDEVMYCVIYCGGGPVALWLGAVGPVNGEGTTWVALTVAAP